MLGVSDASKQRDGAIWAYRFAVNRNPSEIELELVQPMMHDPKSIMVALTTTSEFTGQLRFPHPAMPLVSEERRQAILWAFRFFLGRELVSETDIAALVECNKNINEVKTTLLLSEEFRIKQDASLTPLYVNFIIQQFGPVCTEPAEPGSFRDFLGTTTRCAFLPSDYNAISQAVLGPPGSPGNPPLHEAAEWIGTLLSVIEAKDRVTVVELGAGWAPWLVAAYHAARRRGLTDIHLIGVEGALGHVGFMRQNFIDNGIDPDLHTIIHGNTSTPDGTAQFPPHPRPNEDYGASARFEVTAPGEMTAVPCYSLRTLLAGCPPLIDLIHCDVQGAEADILTAAAPLLDERVRRVVVGTHSRTIEGALLELFSELGWRLEHESNCVYQQAGSGHLTLLKDGEQVWRNPRL